MPPKACSVTSVKWKRLAPGLAQFADSRPGQRPSPARLVARRRPLHLQRAEQGKQPVRPPSAQLHARVDERQAVRSAHAHDLELGQVRSKRSFRPLRARIRRGSAAGQRLGNRLELGVDGLKIPLADPLVAVGVDLLQDTVDRARGIEGRVNAVLRRLRARQRGARQKNCCRAKHRHPAVSQLGLRGSRVLRNADHAPHDPLRVFCV